MNTGRNTVMAIPSVCLSYDVVSIVSIEH